MKDKRDRYPKKPGSSYSTSIIHRHEALTCNQLIAFFTYLFPANWLVAALWLLHGRRETIRTSGVVTSGFSWSICNSDKQIKCSSSKTVGCLCTFHVWRKFLQTVKSHLATWWCSNSVVSLIQWGERADSPLWRGRSFWTTEEGQTPLISQLEKERFLLLFYLYVVRNCSTTRWLH